MAFLNEREKVDISDAIRRVESRTSGELVTVIAARSDTYRYIPLLWAAVIALSAPGLYFLWEALSSSGWRYPGDSNSTLARLYPIQVLLFLGIGMLLQIPACRMAVIPRAVKQQRAARHAHEQFFRQNLHLTQDRTGVLVFVSVAEHYVEIIVDQGISARVDNEIWTETVDEFIRLVKAGRIAEGFERTIEHIGQVLDEHFPADSKRQDELPNHLIEV